MNLWLIVLVCIATGRKPSYRTLVVWTTTITCFTCSSCWTDCRISHHIHLPTGTSFQTFTSDGWVMSHVHKWIELASSIMVQLDAVWRHSRLSLNMKPPSLFLCSAVCSAVWTGSMDVKARWWEMSTDVSYEGTALHSANQLVWFYYQWFHERADKTCWPFTGHSWSQTCQFGPHYPPSWRNTAHTVLQHVVNVTKGSHLAEGWKHPPGRPRKTWLQQVIT